MEKSDPAGWYGEAPEALAETLFIVEGPLDRAALACCGIDRGEVIALVGTALDVTLFPKTVKRVILALDGDQAGREGMQRLARDLRSVGIKTTIAAPDDTDLGKDCSERYRRAGSAGIAYVLDAWEQAQERPAGAPIPRPRPLPVSTVPSINDGMFSDIPMPADASPIDAKHLGEMFHSCPWYDDTAPSMAAGRAAQWICASETNPTRPHTMGVYRLLLHAFDREAIPMTPALAEHVTVPERMGLAPFINLLRHAYATNNHSLARACVDAVLAGGTAQEHLARSYGQHVRELMQQGSGYMEACATVTAANMAALGERETARQ